MTPYYQDDYATLYHGDCWELLPGLPDVPALVTDPPYGIGMVSFEDEIEVAARGVSLSQAKRAAIFCSPRTIWEFWRRVHGWNFERLLWLHKAGDIAHSWRGWCMNSEAIVIASRDREGWPSPLRARTDLYAESFSGGKNGHPAAKPLNTVTDLVARLSTEGETILDPFAGSGTTLRAAKDLGRRAIGIEIEERYCEIAARRLSQEVLGFRGAEPERGGRKEEPGLWG